ncbi:hypothetical protein [Mycobacteroides abscessus]|uniref:hypothetical protein n=1 Tax=Mycobacteroides abscessus TaxID=36809 RepID=UPI0009268153|nr:hypothetical protein [Mycobacteroides abscessus]SIE39074.1 Uncharacterised protein [Mycobacteroides abscessus subsp. abscessus]
MTGQLELLARCALPGCPDVVTAPGDVCAGCVQACGPYLARREPRPEVTPEQVADELAERDRGTIAAYAAQAAAVADADPAVEWLAKRRVEKHVTVHPEVLKVIEAVEVRKSNQLCWLCEERRACTHIEGRWECDKCRSIQ